MEEKKTKKMTKAEAFEYLKHKKIDASINEREVQLKLFSLGVVWCTLDSNLTLGVNYLLIDEECHMTHCGCDLNYYKTHRYEEISADDILSIGIVEEKKGDERKGEILDEIAKLGEKISDLIEEYDGDIVIEINQYEVLLRNSGNFLYRK